MTNKPTKLFIVCQIITNIPIGRLKLTSKLRLKNPYFCSEFVAHTLTVLCRPS